MTIIYEAPWICHLHSYWTKNKAEFMQHLHDVPHEQIVKDYCMMCGAWYEGNVPFRGLNEPVIVLCATCQQVPSAVEWVRAKRRAEFPADKTVKSF